MEQQLDLQASIKLLRAEAHDQNRGELRLVLIHIFTLAMIIV
jgi:hypothetical protein